MRRTIDGLSINYIEAGEEHRGDEPLLLLLHGWGSRASLFDGVIRFASSRYHCLAPDMPGFGDSDEPGASMDVDDYVDFVLRFLADVAPDEREVILLGHSMGGRIIIKLCARLHSGQDGETQAVTPADGREAVFFSVPKVILTDSAGVKPVQSKAQGARAARYRVYKAVLGYTGIAKLFPGMMEALRRHFGSEDYRNATPVMRQTLVRVVNEDLTPYMPLVTQPALLIWGDLDTATPLSDAARMEELMPEAGIAVISGAGHYSFLDAPAWYNSILGSFLNIK